MKSEEIPTYVKRKIGLKPMWSKRMGRKAISQSTLTVMCGCVTKPLAAAYFAGDGVVLPDESRRKKTCSHSFGNDYRVASMASDFADASALPVPPQADRKQAATNPLSGSGQRRAETLGPRAPSCCRPAEATHADLEAFLSNFDNKIE